MSWALYGNHTKIDIDKDEPKWTANFTFQTRSTDAFIPNSGHGVFFIDHSRFTSDLVNLSPFTKDIHEVEQQELNPIFYAVPMQGWQKKGKTEGNMLNCFSTMIKILGPVDLKAIHPNFVLSGRKYKRYCSEKHVVSVYLKSKEPKGPG